MPSLKAKQYVEEGQNAALCGKKLDDCPYRKAERKANWVRGYHQGKLLAQQQPLTPVQHRTNVQHIAHLRQQLNTTNKATA